MQTSKDPQENAPTGALIGRRSFLRSGARVAGTVAVTGPLQALLHRSAVGAPLRKPSYGELSPVHDETTGLPLLKLPDGFRYRSFGWTGDEMSDGTLTPPAHDGMAVTAQILGRVVLTRNHEVSGNGVTFGESRITYDSRAPGGTSNLLFDTRNGEVERSWVSISGTLRNCAGGPTPWNSWLTCEETVLGPGDTFGAAPNEKTMQCEREHGWIFEVPALGPAVPVPIKDMGRFVHEAVAVDPETGIVYETEDRTPCGFYRFVPRQYGLLHLGGSLQMLKVRRDSLMRDVEVGEAFDVEWVRIEDPTSAHSPGTKDGAGVFQRGKQRGGTSFARLEGCWYADGLVYFASTSGGNVGQGQIWLYDPREERLKLVFESPAKEVLNAPDNITVSPRGGILVCEDGDWPAQRLHGLTADGEIFPFAENHVVLQGERNGIYGDFRGSEWAGATFSPDGEWLFVNIQRPGITFAITGSWQEGAL